MIAKAAEDRPATAMSDPARWFPRTVLTMLPWLGIVGMLLMLVTPVLFVPAEDATILYQYSDNWASTGQITYYKGGPRAEGATDFLWMAILAALRLLHIEPYWATAVVNVACSICIAFLLLLLAGEQRRWQAMLLCIGLLISAPQLSAALAGFSVLPFSALLFGCVYCLITKRDAALGIFCLLLCLFRPDGVVFALPLLLLRVASDRQGASRHAGIFLLLFVLPGLGYFVWRWKYFGEFLPLPFLVKSDTPRFLGVALSSSNVDLLKYLAFDGVLLGTLLGRSIWTLRNLQVLVTLGVLPTLFYLTMRLDQDVADRFFAYLLVCASVLVALNWALVRERWERAIKVFSWSWLFFLSYSWASAMTHFVSDGYKSVIVSVARELKGVQPTGTLALSEAGRIAYFSHWPTTDMWGLDTPQFAHRLFAPSDVGVIAPDILVLYYPQTEDDCRYRTGWKVPHTARTWSNLAQNAIAGVHESGGYDLWLVPSSGYLRRAIAGYRLGAGEHLCWFLKKSFAGHEQITRILQENHGVPASEFYRLRQGSGAISSTTKQGAALTK